MVVVRSLRQVALPASKSPRLAPYKRFWQRWTATNAFEQLGDLVEVDTLDVCLVAGAVLKHFLPVASTSRHMPGLDLMVPTNARHAQGDVATQAVALPQVWHTARDVYSLTANLPALLEAAALGTGDTLDSADHQRKPAPLLTLLAESHDVTPIQAHEPIEN